MSENEDQGQQSGSGLRRQLEDALATIETLKQQVTEGQTAHRELAFIRAGIDIESGPGKLLAKAYDGDLDPEAIKSAAQEYGIGAGSTDQGQTPGREQLDPAQQRMDSLRAQSRPAGEGQRLSTKEFLALNQSDPQAARAAYEAGAVDVDPRIAAQLNQNRPGAA